MAVDLTQIQSLQAQISALTQQMTVTAPGPAQDVIKAQIAGLQAQMTAAINAAQAQNQSWTNMFGLLSGISAINSAGGIANVTALFKGFKL